MINYDKMIKLFELANNNFLQEEYELINSEVSERTLCGSLMSYIKDSIQVIPELDGYFVDIEYNRNKGRVKTIVDKDLTLRINCDLILHSRGLHAEQDNLIAIEMKKSNRPICEKEKDRRRLIALTKDKFDDIWSFDGKTLPEHVCRYVLGVFYEIDYRVHEIRIEYYKKGNKETSYSLPIPN